MQTTFYLPTCVRVVNNDLSITGTQTIVITANVQGYSNFNVTVTNDNGSNISDVSVYASADGFNYYTVHTAAITGLASGSTQNYAFSLINRFVRITATSGGTSTINCYLLGDA